MVRAGIPGGAPDRRAVPRPRRPRRPPRQRDAAGHHPPGPPVPLRAQGRAGRAHRRPQRLARDDARRRAATWSATCGCPAPLPDREAVGVESLAKELHRRTRPRTPRTTSCGWTASWPSGVGLPPARGARTSRSTGPRTCPGSSRSASPGPATTASTPTARTSAAVPELEDGRRSVGLHGPRRRRARQEPRRAHHVPPPRQPPRLRGSPRSWPRWSRRWSSRSGTTATAPTATTPV